MIDHGDLVLGVDVGTSGVRLAAVDAGEALVAMAAVPMAAADVDGPGVRQDPEVWWRATVTAFADMATRVDLRRVRAVSVDGTSGTIVGVDAAGAPMAAARMYNDHCRGETARRIAAVAPPETAAHGSTSALGRAIELQQVPGVVRILHQADWIAGRLSGRFDVTDENNALKTGYDPVARCWPPWIAATGVGMAKLPQVVPAGTVTTVAVSEEGRALGLAPATMFVAGTTDGCAAFLATGAGQAGDAVTSLGSTLVVKLMSPRPLFVPQVGLYSHRVGDSWLAGGASNAGGAALRKYFTPERMAELEGDLDPDHPTGLDYYPLPATGERFPINDPAMEPRVTPRPADDVRFLQGLLEGIAAVEALCYRRLAELGGPRPTSLRTVGGGARNRAWTRIRARCLELDFVAARSEEAAVGTARLAWRGLHAGGR